MQWCNHGIIFQQNLQGYSTHAQLPVVDSSHADYWRIYFSSRNPKNYSLPFYVDVKAGQPEIILGQSEQPIFDVGEAGCFDQHGVMPTEIWKHQGLDYLYYIGWDQAGDKPFTNSIGLAIKNEQGLWKKQPRSVIKGYQGSFYAGTLGIFSPRQAGKKLTGFYLACSEWQQEGDFYDPRYQIALAHSDDGFTWQQNPDIAIAYKSADEGGIVSARVLEQHGFFHMFYAYRGRTGFRDNSQHSYRIGYAQSRNLESWHRHDELMDAFNEELRKTLGDKESSGCDFMQCYPYLVKQGEQVFMFYNGNGFGQAGIAYASLPLSELPSFID